MQKPLDGRRVLLVEDAPYVRDALTMLLEREGAVVVAVATGQEALALTSSAPFDLVLTDLALPDMGGDAVVSGARAAWPRVRALVLTASGEPLMSRARAAGAEVVLEKPVEWGVLLDRLARRAA